MKIGLLTHHWVPNFGANLQALATFSYLTQLGHQVVVLNYIPQSLEERYASLCRVSTQIDEHTKFCSTHLNISPLVRSDLELSQYVFDENFDLIICGSDAVLRLYKDRASHEGPFPNPFWLDWVRKHENGRPKKAFISASCTGSNYLTFPSSLRSEIYRLLKGMDYISVRDNWTKLMLQFVSNLTISAQVSPDPVVMFNDVFPVPEKYDRRPESSGQPYILFSVHPDRVNESWVSKFVETCHDEGYIVCGLPFPEFEMPYSSLDRNILLPISPLDWYSVIKNSSGFVGERFHPMMVSLVNMVPFVSIDHYRKRGIMGKFQWLNIPQTSKIYAVCSDAGLVNNCIHYPRLMHMDPADILARLRSWNGEKAKLYNLVSNAKFKKVMSEILSLG